MRSFCQNKFTTKKEINEYFLGDRLQCLICGKWYIMLGIHLLRAHDMTCDEYKLKYGLPWVRGLVPEETRIKQSNTAKRLVNEGRIAKHFDYVTFHEKAIRSDRRPIQPYHKKLLHDRGVIIIGGVRNPSPPGLKPKWLKRDYEKYLTRLQSTGCSVYDAYNKGGLPHPNSLYKYAKKNPDFQKRLIAVSKYRGAQVAHKTGGLCKPINR